VFFIVGPVFSLAGVADGLERPNVRNQRPEGEQREPPVRCTAGLGGFSNNSGLGFAERLHFGATKLISSSVHFSIGSLIY